MQRWILLIILCCSLIACGGSGEGSVFVEPEAPPHVPIERFGVVWEGLEVDSGTVQPGHSLSHILGPAGVSAGAITNLANETKSTYDVRNIQLSNPIGSP